MLIVWLPRFGGGGGGSSSSSSVVDGVIVASDKTDSSSESDIYLVHSLIKINVYLIRLGRVLFAVVPGLVVWA